MTLQGNRGSWEMEQGFKLMHTEGEKGKDVVHS